MDLRFVVTKRDMALSILFMRTRSTHGFFVKHQMNNISHGRSVHLKPHQNYDISHQPISTIACDNPVSLSNYIHWYIIFVCYES